jgi:hypothetical protein
MHVFEYTYKYGRASAPCRARVGFAPWKVGHVPSAFSPLQPGTNWYIVLLAASRSDKINALPPWRFGAQVPAINDSDFLKHRRRLQEFYGNKKLFGRSHPGKSSGGQCGLQSKLKV